MEPPQEGWTAKLLGWYSNLRPHTVDIVGDFAGRELFLVHGESLIRYCLEGVDFDDGFQLLHAVWAVEDFLSKLHKRGCNFDIVFFHHAKEFCAPPDCKPENVYKYQLARDVLIEHLSRAAPTSDDGLTPAVLQYESPNDPKLSEYLKSHAINFFLCHEGEDESLDAVRFRLIIHKFVSRRNNVAIINRAEFKSSKVFFPLISGTASDTRRMKYAFEIKNENEASEMARVATHYIPKAIEAAKNTSHTLSLRIIFSIAICKAIWDLPGDDDKEYDEMITAFMLHTAMLHSCSLLDRQADMPLEKSEEGAEFLCQFSDAARFMLKWYNNFNKSQELEMDLYDLIDGRLFFCFLERVKQGKSFPKRVLALAQSLLGAVMGDAKSHIQHITATRDGSSKGPTTNPTLCKVMPFEHPVFDQFLADMSLEMAPKRINEVADVVFEDLTHWHNSRKSVIDDDKPSKLTYYARTRQQRLMADMTEYSASVTNAQGKALEPENVIAKSKKRPSSGRAHNNKTETSEKNNTQPDSKWGKKQTFSCGGRASALKAAAQVQESKALKKRGLVADYWKNECVHYEGDRDLISRYLKAYKFLLDKSSKNDALALGSEVELYLCNVLGRIWADGDHSTATKTRRNLYLMAMASNLIQQCSRNISLTPEVSDTLGSLTQYLGMPDIPFLASSPGRDLSFQFDFQGFKSVQKLKLDYKALQLEHGGPYMDRRFDSQPDPRVRFEPDAWQRKVLDSIDANRSLLVIAPTSAGKTFISFYAMKKILEADDEGVIVYVAPTKALVNQIAAEINARYSKSYHGKAAKSVWAIHTRDYRVNNPRQSQILVTVPHILQIMLLSPHNANGPRAWSKRVKRIIFDEVHCIGQSEDGVIWEQLLLLAPCPIIALSATVGNPREFRDWLALAQKKRGNQMDMVVHSVRYSELRKFIYEPPRDFKFQGLSKTQKLPVPGLDEGPSRCESFKFIHPISALIERNRGALGDLSLEARDCFVLWKEMQSLLSEEELAELDVLHPSQEFPATIAKSDTIQWENKLKKALVNIIDEKGSVFNKLRTRLEGPFKKTTEIDQTSDFKKALFSLACHLHQQDALPALAFSYDRMDCEKSAKLILQELTEAEKTWKETSPEWRRKLQEFDAWQRSQAKKPTSTKVPVRKKDKQGDKDRVSKLDLVRTETSADQDPWDLFDTDAPLDQFSFADHSKLQRSDFREHILKLKRENILPWAIKALRRGVGFHHAGMNRRYRQIVEMFFRKGYLRLVVATGTLALGINMPCKTVIFNSDYIFLTAQNYRQASGRAGRRGFDLLGNIVFNGIPKERVYEIMSSRLPDLRGQFPISTTLILRIFGLLHGTKNSEFAVNSISSLLSDTRLYLGGPEARGAVKHHLRFSIDYLRRQYLLSAKGEPVNFAGLVGHLYFTENSVFAFHSLLKGGYFHKLCSNIDRNPEKVLLELVLVLSHLFNRIPVKRTQQFVESIHRSSSVVFLPRLPEEAEQLLIEHNRETLAIFRDYVHSYVSQNLTNEPDQILPFTNTSVGQRETLRSPQFSLSNKPSPTIRSPFIALSGSHDSFSSIHELCTTVRGGVFLEESAIPYIPIWPHDTATEYNAYLYDFFKNGSMDVLSRDNRIKGGDVWFFLKDFSLTLAAIVTSLEGLAGHSDNHEGGEDDQGGDAIDMQEFGENEAELKAVQKELALETQSLQTQSPGKKKPKAKLNENWDDCGDSGEEDDQDNGGKPSPSRKNRTNGNVASESEDGSVPAWQQDGQGIASVLRAFVLLRNDWNAKFMKVWA